MKRILSIILTFLMLFSMCSSVFADNLVVDGDNLAPVVSNALDLGSVGLGACTKADVLLAISRNGESTKNSFADNASISVNYISSNDANVSATINDGLISIPNNWDSVSNNTMTIDTAASSVLLSVAMNTSLGTHKATLTYSATGLGMDEKTVISRTGTLTVTYIVVNANPTVSPWPSATIVYGQSLTASSFSGGTASYNGVSVPGTFTYSGLPTTLLDAGSYSYDTTFTPSDNKYNTVTSKSFVTVNKANALINVTGFSGTYDGSAHAATGTATGVNGENLSDLLNLGSSFTDAPGGTANWAFAGNDNYNSASGTTSIAISKADATVTVKGYTGTYDGTAHGATGSATGVKNEDLSSLLHLGSAFTDASNQTVNWTFDGNTDYNTKSGSVEINIDKVDAVINVTGFSGKYDGKAHGASGTAKGINGEDLSNLLHFSGTYTNAGEGKATWTFDGNDNYNAARGEVAINIAKADPTVTVNGYTGTYDGQEHGATGKATGVKDEDLSSLLNLGSSFTDAPGGTANWTFVGDDNYNPALGTATIAIGKADATIAVVGYYGTYDGNPHGATGKATGVKDEDLSSLLNLGSSFTDAPGGTANWTFTGNDNYNSTDGEAIINVRKADAKVIVDGYSGTYDGEEHGATGTATGVKDEDLSSLVDLGETFTNAPGGTATWTFVGNVNYNDNTGTVNIVISKADANIAVKGYSGTYDGDPHSATGTATGVKGESLISLLNLGSSFTDAPGGTAHWTFVGNGNYNVNGGEVDIDISKADANIAVKGYSGTYDGDPHSATGTATGVKGESLASLLNLGPSFTDAPGGIANWIFTGNVNYNDASGTADIKINQADANVKVKGYSGTYDGNAHGATGTATGVKNEDLSSLLDLGAPITNASTETVNWTFSGNTDYKSQHGTVEINIGKADATIDVKGFSGKYDGKDHGATGTATGIGGVDLSGLLHITGSFTDAPGGKATWTFDGNENYNAASGEVTIDIQKADAAITVNEYSGIYDGNAHGATGTATGVNNEDLTGLLNLGSKFTNAPGGTAEWTFAGNGNYNAASGTAAIAISKANARISVNGYTGTYDGNAHGASGTATGVKGEDLKGSLNLGTQFTNVPGGTANWTFAGGTNYNDAYGSVSIVIDRYKFGGILQPINRDNSSQFKLGSTIPVKFQLKDDSGNYITNAVGTLSYATVTAQGVGSFISAVSSSSADNGNVFRYDSTSNQYIFNLSTKSTSVAPWATGVYQLKVKLNDDGEYTVNVTIK